MGYTWSDRMTVDTLAADTDAVANLIPRAGRTELVVGTGGAVQMVPLGSLDGGWGEPVTVTDSNGDPVADVEPCGDVLFGRTLVVAVGGGTVRLWTLAEGTWQAIAAADNVYEPFGSTRFPALAVHPYQWRLFAATWQGARTILSTSPDRGADWHDGHDIEGTVWVAAVDNLQYPALCMDRNTLWLVGWLEGAYRGAEGKVMLYRYDAQADIAAVGEGVVIGASDEGRPAIIRRPYTGEMIVLAPKTGSGWTDVAGTGRGIAEFHSVDTGATWSFEAFHEVA